MAKSWKLLSNSTFLGFLDFDRNSSKFLFEHIENIDDNKSRATSYRLVTSWPWPCDHFVPALGVRGVHSAARGGLWANVPVKVQAVGEGGVPGSRCLLLTTRKNMNESNIWLYKDDDKLEFINHCVVWLLHWNGQSFKGGPFPPYHGTSNITKIAKIGFEKGIFVTFHVPNETYLHQFAWKTGYSHASHVYKSSTSSTHPPVQKDSPKKSSIFASCSWK